MKSKLLLLLYFSFIFFYSTEAQEVREDDSLVIISKSFPQHSREMPTLKLSSHYKGNKAPELPSILDNSELLFFRPIFSQMKYSCGQAASIGYAFTYEMSRLRGLVSNADSTQYPPHFAWNWENGGNAAHGVSYFHSFDVLKSVGIPNTETYGGFYGPYGIDQPYLGRYWMSGYDKYYQAMKNRLSESYRIDVSTIEGIQTLKYWLYDHLDGSTYGGVATFYSNGALGSVLPNGTPEEGKYVSYYYGENPTHAMTICGFHDSICWDYNGDGLYTNDVDINGDGEINLKDWEIGGFKYADSWMGVESGNEGFHYMTYKSCTDSIIVNGYLKHGIWKSEVHVQYVKENADPKLTAKITLKYDWREKIRVRMGCSQDITSLEPEHIILFPIFNFQGGYWNMQGSNKEKDKTIEFGLDITPLMDMLPNGSEARFFLLVDEDDPENEGEGEVISFSLMDYTNGVEEIVCSQSNIPIENGTTKLWIDHAVNYTDVNISTEILTGAVPEQEYYFQVEAEGGTKPYFFSFDKSYQEEISSQNFISIDEIAYEEALVTQELGFEFPFYGENYQQLSISENGYIFFDNYIVDSYSHFYQLFQENKVIMPFSLSSENDTLINEGMWYQGNSDSAVFRWKAHIPEEPSSILNFSLILFRNGEIHFSYGENTFATTAWVAGISAGQNKIYQYTQNSSFPNIDEGYLCKFTPTQSLDSLQISNTGLISGFFREEYMDKELAIKVQDASNLSTNKTLTFSSEPYCIMQLSNFQMNSLSCPKRLGYGDTVKISAKIKNLGTTNPTGVQLLCHSNSPYIEFLEDEIQAGDFEHGEEKIFEGTISFVISKKIPEICHFEINTTLKTDDGKIWERKFQNTAFMPKVKTNCFDVLDSLDYALSPGETANIHINIENIGFIPIENLKVIAASYSSDLTLNTKQGLIDTLKVNETESILLNVSVDENTKEGSVIPLSLLLETPKGYRAFLNIPITIGSAMEDFETGDLSQYNWDPYYYGDSTWCVDSGSPFEGSYSAKTITDKELAGLTLEENFLARGKLSFSYFLSSSCQLFLVGQEESEDQIYDEKENWSIGTYPVSKGNLAVQWLVVSDEPVLLDNISFPPVGAINPELSYFPLQFQDTLYQDIFFIDTLRLSNTGNGTVYFSTIVIDSLMQEVDWVQVSPKYGKIKEGESFKLRFIVNAQDLSLGVSKAILRVFDHKGKAFDIPIRFYLRPFREGTVCNNFEVTCFPNPFQNSVRIDFKTKERQNIDLQIFDLQGRIIRSEHLGITDRGVHSFYWKGDNKNGIQVPTGVYYLSISSDKSNCTQKLLKIQ